MKGLLQKIRRRKGNGYKLYFIGLIFPFRFLSMYFFQFCGAFFFEFCVAASLSTGCIQEYVTLLRTAPKGESCDELHMSS